MSPNQGFNARTAQVADWRTPAWLFKALDTEFAFDTDGAADESNRLCDRFIARIDDWQPVQLAGRRVFCNPPYSNIAPFVRMACAGTGLWVLLLPARTRSGWFEMLRLHKAEFRWLRKRIAFDPPPGVEASSPRMDTFIAVVRCATTSDDRESVDGFFDKLPIA